MNAPLTLPETVAPPGEQPTCENPGCAADVPVAEYQMYRSSGRPGYLRCCGQCVLMEAWRLQHPTNLTFRRLSDKERAVLLAEQKAR